MMIFYIAVSIIFCLIAWQSIAYLLVPRGVLLRKTILIRLLFLVVVLGLCTYAWRAALLKETQFLDILPPYPDAKLDLLETPIFSNSPYWTYVTSTSADQVFNWYRSRSKHAGWIIADEGTPGARVIVISAPSHPSVFMVLHEEGGKTTITYTTEGEMMRKSIAN